MPDIKPARRKAWKGRLGDSEMKLEKLPSGNYRIRVTIGYTPDNKPIRKSFTHSDKKTLRRIASEYADTHRHATTNQSVGVALDAMIAAKTPVLSPSTVRAYTSMTKTLKNKHARFCALSVHSVSRQDLQTFVNTLVGEGRAPKTVRNYHGMLSAAFKFAGYNLPPVTLPQKEHPDIHIPDEKILSRIMEAAREKGLEVPIALGVMGMRRSEICALTLDDLDGSVLHVRKAVVYGPDKLLHEKLTKNYMSDRYVRIPDAIAAKIREQGYVTDQTPAALSHAFDRLLEANGLPHYRLHDLRHFCASYCHNILHMSDAQIQAITGHKTSVVLREHYLHSMRDDATAKRVANRLAKLM